MTLRGDLSTLDLADLVQNLETHRRSGVLSVEGAGGVTRLCFEEGKLTLLARDGRVPLADALVSAGLITGKALDAARRKRKLTRKSLGETLVASRRIKTDALRDFAAQRLLDEACELMVTRSGAFTFEEGALADTSKGGAFDAEEKRLGLSLAAGPLLMEAARREDHWNLIRRRVPSDAAHFRVERPVSGLVEPELLELAETLAADLDGVQSVGEVMERFPHRRFEAYHCLSVMCERHVVELVDASDMASLARERASGDPELAAEIVERGLRETPQNKELLVERARLAEAAGDHGRAVECLKLLVPLHLEVGDREQAKLALVRAKRFAPNDTSLFERSLELALEDGRKGDALADGRELVRLLREPGLHARAARVLRELLNLEPDSWDLACEHARERAASGDVDGAVEELEERARGPLSAGQFLSAKVMYEEILRLHPRHEKAQRILEEIESGALAARRARRATWLRRSILVLVLVASSGAAIVEGAGRRALIRAEADILADGLLRDELYEEAMTRYRSVAAAHRYSSTAWYDVEHKLTALRALRAERDRQFFGEPTGSAQDR